MVYPTTKHRTIAKRVLRYLKGTIDFSLIFEKEKKNHKIRGYGDGDFIGDMEDMKST